MRMTHIEKADIKLVSSEAGEIFDDEIYSKLAWLASQHAAKTCSGAELLESPMSELQGFQMMDQFGLIAGYLIVDIEELFDADLEEVKQRISKKLVSDVDVEELNFEVVWGHSQTLMIYACGKATG